MDEILSNPNTHWNLGHAWTCFFELSWAPVAQASRGPLTTRGGCTIPLHTPALGGTNLGKQIWGQWSRAMKCHPVGHMSSDISWINEQMDEERGPAASFCTPLSFCLSLCLQASLSLAPLLCFFACFFFFYLFLFLTRTSHENYSHFLRESLLSWPRDGTIGSQ